MEKKGERKYVWDAATRLYHWLQFLLVTGALSIGFFGPEWFLDAHIYAGYGVLALIVFRLVWGFWGPTYSRFVSFLFPLREIIAHTKGVLKGEPSHHLGHNPLGALMVYGLIGVLILILASGLIVLGGVENQGPLAGFASFDFGIRVRFVHRVLAYLLVGMIGLHIVGVLVETRLSKFSLIRSMIDGWKPRGTGESEDREVPARPGRALMILVSAGVVIVGAGALASAVPASGVIELPPNEPFNSECTACHELYSPSLLPAESWKLLMANLEDHFGEDASLDDSTTQEITRYLMRYSSEKWDTEAANRLRAVNPDKPYEITATSFWKRNHAQIDPKTFESRPVFSKGNCSTCHLDARTGRFDDQKIQIAHGQKQGERTKLS